MIEGILKQQLNPIARRQRQLRLWRAWAYCWGITAVIVLATLFSQQLLGVSTRWLLPILVGGAVIAAWWMRKQIYRWKPDYGALARDIEKKHPDLHALLLTAVEQEPDPKTGKFHYLQERLLQQAVALAKKDKWIETVTPGEMFKAQTAHAIALMFVLGLLLVSFNQKNTPSVRVARGEDVSVTPGDITLEKGNGFAVLVRFQKDLPAEAILVLKSGTNEQRISLVKNLSDPVFGGSIPEVTANLSYQIEYSGKTTRPFQVTVFEYPKLERADARIRYPEFTQLPEKKLPDTRQISAVEGSLIDWTLQFNKPVASARLMSKDKTVLALKVVTNTATLGDYRLATNQTYHLQLVDREGRTNKVPAELILAALKNRAPELKLTSPRNDSRFSPLEEINMEAEVWDDYGLKKYGVAYQIGGGEPSLVELGAEEITKEKKKISHALRLEDLSAKPDQLISYFLWAEDTGPDGQIRRTMSDLYFAEIRPFEEIYRENPGGDSSGESEEGAGNESFKLAEIQKQIISATWKLDRTAKETKVQQYAKDAQVVLESQKLALDEAGNLKERIQDPRMQVMVDTAMKEMNTAIRHLTAATNSPAPLPKALSSEQAAYQALLSLQAREYSVSRSRSRSRSASSAQRNQQQLDQLELKNEEDRYESQRQASPQQSAEQKEQLQLLTRLKELAQRQQDLNERLKELQTALQEAKTEAEKEEIRRRLKRLRDEEREMLADVDSLRQRMEQPQNQARTAEARQQLEKTRANVQEASEAMEKEAVAQAIASGTRAQRELQELRDDFRKQNSSAFSEEMKQMRSDARQLNEDQKKVGESLEKLGSNQKSLRENPENKALAEKIQQQKQGMTNLLEQMRNVSEKAESPEPLLSKQLYDTLRKSSQGNWEKSLEITEQLVKRNFPQEAVPFEAKARQEIEEIKKGVERAAESVLGDETEALRTARKALDDLQQQIDNEIAGATGGTNASGGTNALLAANGRQGQNSQSRAGTNQNNSARSPGQPSESQANAGSKGEQPSQNESGAQANGQGQQPGSNPSASNQGTPGQGQGQGQGQDGKGSPQNQQNQSASNSPGNNSPGNTPGSQPGGQSPSGQGQGTGQGQSQASANSSQGTPTPGGRDGTSQADASNRSGTQNRGGDGSERFFDGLSQSGRSGNAGGSRPSRREGPLTGNEYLQWSERLSEVEEMVDQPDLRAELARVREQARNIRAEYKRHSKEPNWPLVKAQISAPLAEVRKRVAEELARRDATDPLVPIDRDPVPTKYSELVRKYYESLGKGE